MDLANQQLHFTGYISTSHWTLNQADSLIALAEKDTENAKTLAACAAILLAAALEQGVKTVLTYAGKITAVDEDIDFSETDHADLLDRRSNSQWSRVRLLPSILTDRRFRLIDNHPHSQYLYDLIITRNKLVHVDEQAVHLISPNDKIKVEDNRVTVEFSVPLTLWETVKLEKVKGFREAVTVYLREVLFPESGEITEGTIISAAS